jgi:hypothetical protein
LPLYHTVCRVAVVHSVQQQLVLHREYEHIAKVLARSQQDQTEGPSTIQRGLGDRLPPMCTECQGEQRFAHSTSALGEVDVPRLQSTLPSKELLPNEVYTPNLTVPELTLRWPSWPIWGTYHGPTCERPPFHLYLSGLCILDKRPFLFLLLNNVYSYVQVQ